MMIFKSSSTFQRYLSRTKLSLKENMTVCILSHMVVAKNRRERPAASKSKDGGALIGWDTLKSSIADLRNMDVNLNNSRQ